MKTLPQDLILASAKNIKTLEWVTSPVPVQFKPMIDAAWYCVGRVTESPKQQAYFCLVMKQKEAERCLVLIHMAGDDAPTTLKFADVADAKEWVKKTLSEQTVIARFATFH